MRVNHIESQRVKHALTFSAKDTERQMMTHLETHGVGMQGLPAGSVLTIDDLPPRFNRRWSAEQKAQLLSAIDGGLLSLDEAASYYALNVNDLAGWKSESTRAIDLVSAPRSAEPGVDRLSRLVAILVQKGVLDSWDVASMSLTPEAAMTSRISAFLTDDRPIC
jgi:hypothetical protein